MITKGGVIAQPREADRKYQRQEVARCGGHRVSKSEEGGEGPLFRNSGNGGREACVADASPLS